MPHNETCKPFEKCRIIILLLYQIYIRYHQNVKYNFGANSKVPLGTVTYFLLSLYVFKLLQGDFYKCFFEQMCATYVASCYIC